MRETFEELGLRIDARELQFLATLRESCVLNGGTYIDNEIHDVYVVRRDVDIASLKLQSGEVDDVVLVSELPATGMVPHAAEYALLTAILPPAP